MVNHKAPTKITSSRPRNPVSQNPLLKKSHAHTTSKKAERAKAKQQINKDLADQ